MIEVREMKVLPRAAVERDYRVELSCENPRGPQGKFHGSKK